MKLVVEVVDAHNLMPKDGQGSASPSVEVDFENHRFRTRTKEKDLSPVWNEKLVFKVADPANLHNQTVDVYVYNENKSNQSRNFLGKVRIHGSSIVKQGEEVLQRFPLEKRSIFSRIKGDIGLKIYYVEEEGGVEEIRKEEAYSDVKSEAKQYIHKQQTGSQQGKSVEERRTEARPVIMHTLSRQHEDYSLKETSPHLGGGWTRGEKVTSTYDLVEQMQYLYVRVVKAKDLPAKDITGSCDPYVEVKLGNYKGTTKHFEKKTNPEWNQVFAFSKERIQASVLEVTVKDKDVVKDDFIGRVAFDLSEVPTRVPPDSPLAPQWYRLEDRKGESKVKGEIMLAVWMGTQADEAFPEAWHADAAAVHGDGLANIRSKVYLSPKLWYLRVNVIEAQDLQPGEKGRYPEVAVRVQLGNQLLKTRIAQSRTTSPLWNEDLLFVAAEPFEEHLILTVEDRVGPNKDEVLGKTIISLTTIEKRIDYRPVNSRWFNLEKPSAAELEKKKEVKFASRIHLRLSLDGGYHVLDESALYTSDLRPTAKQLWKPYIGVLEVGILSGQALLPMKTKDGRGATDAYCVARYGQKWVRTRTIIDSFNPKWNEQYTWEVYDPCTVIPLGVFYNCHLQGGGSFQDSSSSLPLKAGLFAVQGQLYWDGNVGNMESAVCGWDCYNN